MTIKNCPDYGPASAAGKSSYSKVDTASPKKKTEADMAKAIPAAINPYSMAVAPVWHFKYDFKINTFFIIKNLPLCYLSL